MPEHVRVLVVGGGFGGIATAVGLLRDGITDFVVLERAADVGGVWEANTYPGCRCDVPSHLYSLSFAPNPDWSRTFSAQPEIRDYLRRTADDHGVRAHLRCGVEVLSARWDDRLAHWQVDTSAGEFTAQVLVSGMGPLTEPSVPAIPGLERFAGKVMHSARWDHGHELAGRRVASIGTGASAIQYVPQIQREVAHLDVYQRTAPWVMPHGDRPISDRERLLYRRLPVAQQAVRGAVYVAKELLVLGFAKRPALMRLPEKLARQHLAKQVTDPALLARVTPDYAIGCKRLVPSNKWYPALQKDNVELVTDGIAEIREHSIVDATGVEREVDTIILGTGFHVTDPPVATLVRGRRGVLLADVWQGSPRAYLGTSVPGFPNLFMLCGPNTGLGHSSMVYMIESQVAHVLGVLRAMGKAGATTAEVTPQAYAQHNADVDARMSATVWETGGCASFYIDGTGRNATLWPDWTFRFRRLARRTDDYALTCPRVAQPVTRPVAEDSPLLAEPVSA